MVGVETVRSILGLNFHGIEESCQIFRVNPIFACWERFKYLPWSKKDLMAGCNTDIIFFGAPYNLNRQPLTINFLHRLFPVSGQPRFLHYPGDPYHWYTEAKFARVTVCRLGWYRLKKKAIKITRCQSFYERRGFLKLGQAVAPAVIYTIAAFLHFLTTGEYLYEDEFLWCEDQLDLGRVAAVGMFSQYGWSIETAKVNTQCQWLGLAPMILPSI